MNNIKNCYYSILSSNRDVELATEFLKISNSDQLDVITFAELLQVDLKNPNIRDLFALFVRVSSLEFA